MIDKKMLKVVGAKVAALASTALPVLLAVTVSMKEEIAASSADECSLSVQQNEVLLQGAKRTAQRSAAPCRAATFAAAAMQCDTARHDLMRLDAMQHNVTQHAHCTRR